MTIEKIAAVLDRELSRCHSLAWECMNWAEQAGVNHPGLGHLYCKASHIFWGDGLIIWKEED